MTGNTKAADVTSGNYSFACSVGFTRNPVGKITIAHERHLVKEMGFVERDLDN